MDLFCVIDLLLLSICALLFARLTDFAEKLFKHLEKSKERFEVKLMILNLISRLIGVHKVLDGCGSPVITSVFELFISGFSCFCSISTRLFKDSCSHIREVL